MEETLTSSQQRDHFGFGVEVHPESPFIPAGNCLLKWLIGIETWVMMVIRVADCIFQDIEKVHGGGDIRIAETQVDYVAALFPHFGQTHVHFCSKVRAKNFHTFRYAHFSPPTSKDHHREKSKNEYKRFKLDRY
jgi:hypothetical protein